MIHSIRKRDSRTVTHPLAGIDLGSKLIIANKYRFNIYRSY
jgi:hypothetical protein